MSTKLPRVAITVDDDVSFALHHLSKKQNKSQSHIALELIREALELREDLYYSEIVAYREKNWKYEPIPAEEVWKKLGIE
jgi:predicted DNA-binding protein